MSQFDFSQPDAASPLNLMPLVKFIGSLVWTILLLIVYVFVLAWGTVLEKFYGDGGSKFGIYSTWWFNGLAIILAINVTAGLAAKLPWKRSQLGPFVLPHAGLLVLLLGCLISRLFGQESTVAIIEGKESAEAYKSQQQHIELNGQEHFVLEVFRKGETEKGKPSQRQIIEIPFTPGPFNWDDYKPKTNSLSDWIAVQLPWAFAHIDKGVLYDRDGIRLEVIDYCSDARPYCVPNVQVTAHATNPDGTPRESNQEEAGPMVIEIPSPLSADAPSPPGVESRLPGGTLLRFSMAANQAEMNAFLHASSHEPADAGKGETNSADSTDFGPARIELLQGTDQMLYMRTWRGGQVKQMGKVRAGEAKIPLFQNTSDATTLQLNQFMPSGKPEVRAMPLDFDHEKDAKLQQVRVRLTVDGQSDEFWLAGLSRDPLQQLNLKRHLISLPDAIHRVESDSRRVVASLEPQTFKLGVKIHLEKAWRKLDAGSKNVSYFASIIDLIPNKEAFRDPEEANPEEANKEKKRKTEPPAHDTTAPPAEPAPGQKGLTITLNAPLDFTDPVTGVSYRMFQTGMPGPFPPQQVDSDKWEPVYVSYLTLNHDPGRGWTYLGCLMVVAGIFLTYFGKRSAA